MASVRGCKGRLHTTNLVNKCKALKEIQGSQSCIANSRKFGIVKNTILNWIKHYNIELRTFSENKN